MNCPTCNAWTSINDSRNKGAYIQRRRECAKGHKCNTEERGMVKKRKGGKDETRDMAHRAD